MPWKNSRCRMMQLMQASEDQLNTEHLLCLVLYPGISAASRLVLLREAVGWASTALTVFALIPSEEISVVSFFLHCLSTTTRFGARTWPSFELKRRKTVRSAMQKI